MREKLYIIDGTAYIYRSFFAFKNRPLVNSKGENTSAIFGFLRTIVSIIEQFQPKYFVITFDEKEPTFRHKKYPEYKATRDKMPEELVDQLKPIQELVNSSNIPHLSLSGYEADDIIGTLSKKFSDKCDVVIVSGDKDFYQLVNDKITLFDLSRNKYISKEEVKEKFGTTPDKVIDILALTGDSADNIPGIPKVGIKTAIKLIQQFGSLENILANSKKITQNHIRENVEKFSQKGILSKELVTINRNIPIDVSLEDLTLQNIFSEGLRKFCERYELNTFLKYFSTKGIIFEDNKKDPSPIEKIKYCLVNNKSLFEKLITQLQKQEKIAIDLETDSRSPINGRIVGISICFETNKSYYIPIRHNFGTQLNAGYVLHSLKPILENNSKHFIGHNIKFDFMIFQNEEIEITNLYFDTMVASYLLSPEEHRHNLDTVSLRYLHHKMIPIEELIGKKGKSQLCFTETSVEDAAKYSGEDANITFRLWKVFEKKLAEMDMQNLFFKIEMPLVKTLANMERNGISVDQIFFAKLSKELEIKIAILQKDIHQIAGEIFNIDSPLQLSKILFEKIGLPVVKKTKSSYSTDINVLTKLSRDYEIAQNLIQYRQLKKLKSTYLDALPKLINSRTGRIHSSFNQTVTATGRLSSSGPNLQNIPIRTEIGREMRKGFIPRYSDFSILSADYSQIELRVMAIISQDENLIENFKKGGDVHSQIAALVFGIKENEVTKNQRRQAKVINFGIMYGMGSYSLSQDLRISRKEAQAFIDNYFSHYPMVKNYIDNTIEFAHKNKYVKTIFNRRRYLTGINSRNHQIQAFAERTAINMPIQGTSADIIKIAMNNIYQKIKGKNDEIKMIIQIHDELVFEVKTELIDKYIKLIRVEMESVLPLEYSDIVSLIVDIGYGKNWLEAH